MSIEPSLISEPVQPDAEAPQRRGPAEMGRSVDTLRERLQRLSPPLFLLSIFFIFFAKPIFSARVFYVWDLGRMTLPNLVANAAIRAEEGLPLWNPWTKVGYPMSAESEVGALYPPALLFNLPLGHGQAFSLYILFHYLLAMAGTWFYTREVGLSRQGRTMAVLLFVFSGPFVAQTVNAPLVTTFAWAPLVLACQLKAMRERALGWAAIGGLFLGIQLLGAHPQTAFYLGLMTLPNGLLRTGRGPTRLEIFEATRVIGVLYAVGLAIAAPQLLYNYELLGFTSRSTSPSYAFAVSYSLPPHYLLQLILPDLFGSEEHYAGDGNFYELHLFWSVAALAIIVVGWQQLENKHRAYFRFFLAGFLLLALGRFVYAYRVLQYVPGFNVIRGPARMLIPASLVAGVLAGMGVDALSNDRIRRKWAGRFIVGYAGIALFQCAAGVMGKFGGDGSLRSYRRFVDYLVSQRNGLPPIDAGALAFDARVGAALGAMSRSAVIASIFSLACVVWWYTYRRSRADGGILAAALLMLVGTELVVFESGVNRYESSDFYERVPPLVKVLRGTHGLFRIHARTWDDPFHPNMANLQYTTPVLYRIASTGTGLSMVHNRLNTYLDGPWLLRRLAVANVRYIISAEPCSESGLQEVARDGPRSLCELTDSRPRAFFTRRVEVVPDEHALLDRLDEEGFSPAETALIEERPELIPGRPLLAAGNEAVLEMVSYGALAVSMRVSTPYDGMLVLGDLDYPGWTATVNGQQRRIYRTDYLFRGLHLGRGHHEIEFRYHPRSFFAGLWLAAFVLLSLAMYVSVWIILRVRAYGRRAER